MTSAPISTAGTRHLKPSGATAGLSSSVFGVNRGTAGQASSGTHLSGPHRLNDTANSRSASDYPLSRWCLRPLAVALARCLAATPIRPGHLTLCGLTAAVAAAAVLSSGTTSGISGLLVLLAWFFDRADGALARIQGSASRWGAWLDANVDELVDIGLHVTTAAAAAASSETDWPWCFLLAFIAGKYLFMHGLTGEGEAAKPFEKMDSSTAANGPRTWLRRAYHFPGNADVRIHLLAAALLTGWLTAELCLIAVYYNFRWVARYVLVARRLRGATP